MLNRIIWISAIKDNLSNEKVDQHIMLRRYKRKPVINKKVKPLTSFFLDNNIGKYLISREFRIFAKRINIDDAYESYVKYISDTRDFVIAIPGYTGLDEEAFEFFLSDQYEAILEEISKEEFQKLIRFILVDFANWKKEKLQVKHLAGSLQFLDFPENEIELIFQSLPLKIAFPRIQNLLKKFPITKKQLFNILWVILIVITIASWYLDILPLEYKNLLNITAIVCSAFYGVEKLISHQEKKE